METHWKIQQMDGLPKSRQNFIQENLPVSSSNFSPFFLTPSRRTETEFRNDTQRWKKLSSEKTPQQYASAEQHLPFFHHTCPNRRTSTAPSQSILLTAFKREIGRTKNERNFSSATDCCCCILLYVDKLAAQDPKFSTWKLSLSNAP